MHTHASYTFLSPWQGFTFLTYKHMDLSEQQSQDLLPELAGFPAFPYF